MQRQTNNKEIKDQPSAFPSLNGGQRNVIEGTLDFYINDIHDLTRELRLPPSDALKAFRAMLSTEALSEKDIKQFTEQDTISNIQVVRDILNHPYPQNRAETYFQTTEKDIVLFHLNPDDCDILLDKEATLATKHSTLIEGQTQIAYNVIYKNGRIINASHVASLVALDPYGLLWDFIGKEPIGKLSLTNLEDAKTLPVTKQAVVDYIHFLVNKAIRWQQVKYFEDIKKLLQIKKFLKIVHADTILEIATEGVEFATLLFETPTILEKLEYSHLKSIELFYPNTSISSFLKTKGYKNYFNNLMKGDRLDVEILITIKEILQTYDVRQDFDIVILRRFMHILELIQLVDQNQEIEVDKWHDKDIKNLYIAVDNLLKSAANHLHEKMIAYKKIILHALCTFDYSTTQQCVLLTKNLSIQTLELNTAFIKMMPLESKYFLSCASSLKDLKVIPDMKQLSLKEQHIIDKEFSYALSKRQYDILPKLLAEGADIEHCYGYYFKPLMNRIVNSGKARLINDVYHLLMLGANPNDKLKDDNLIVFGVNIDADATPLMLLLCRDIHFDETTRAVADLLLKFDADINAVTKKIKMTVLHYAVQLKAIHWVSYLVKKGADLTLENNNGLGHTAASMANRISYHETRIKLKEKCYQICQILQKKTVKAFILDELYYKFKEDLRNHSVENIRETLKKNGSLARYHPKNALPPVFLAIPHAISQPSKNDNEKAAQILDLLKEYKADFNAKYFFDSYFGLKINGFINPLAWCLLHSNNDNLFEKVVAYGAEKKHPSIYKVSQLIHKIKMLDDLYPSFNEDLLAGKVDAIKEKLQRYPALATYEKKGMPPVISAIHHSFSHTDALDVLNVLAEYKANFNCFYFIEKHFKFEIQFELNPIAWLLLNGGDDRLIDKLICYGTDKNHPSVNKVIKLVLEHRTDQAFTYPTPYDTNLNERSPYELVLKILQPPRVYLPGLPLTIYKISHYLNHDYKTLTALSQSCLRLYSIYQPVIKRQRLLQAKIDDNRKKIR